MWKAIRENPRAVTYAVLMHLVLLVLLMIGLDWTPKAIKPGVKTPIEAELVTTDQLKEIEQRKAEEAARKQAEAERKAAEARQREAEAALKAQLAAEEERARAQSALAEFIPYIQDRIQRNWLRPAGSPAGLSCLVKVKLIPGGDVVSVSVVRSSGDSVFDRSVETAVLKASPLPLPDDAALFKHFREINFNFDPGR